MAAQHAVVSGPPTDPRPQHGSGVGGDRAGGAPGGWIRTSYGPRAAGSRCRWPRPDRRLVLRPDK